MALQEVRSWGNHVYVGIMSFNDPVPAIVIHYDNVTVDVP